MALVATVVLFFGGLAMKRPVDGAMFFARSAFDRVAVVAPETSTGTATFADVMPRFPVVRAPEAGQTLTFTPDLQTVELDVVDDVQAFATGVLGGNVQNTDGMPGAFVDDDTARRLGVTIGGAIILDSAAIGGQESSPIRVVGIVAPYTSPRNHHETGLVVVDRTLVSERLIADAAPLLPPADGPFRRIYGTPSDDLADAATRADLVAVFVGDLVGRDTILAMAGIVVFAGLLWLAAALASHGPHHPSIECRGRPARGTRWSAADGPVGDPRARGGAYLRRASAGGGSRGRFHLSFGAGLGTPTHGPAPDVLRTLRLYPPGPGGVVGGGRSVHHEGGAPDHPGIAR